jgi:uncharacterized membrane protein
MYRSFLTAFGGTFVEFFETVAIAYAIFRAGYRREAILATALGQIAVFILAFFLWPALRFIPVSWFRLVAASLLTWMGLYWTLKSARRWWQGRRPSWVDKPLETIGVQHATTAVFSLFVFLVMLKSSALEAFEILLVVFPIGAATGQWLSVITGMAAGISVVSAAAILLHGKLQKVPEVTVKLATGILLLGIGVSWLIELRK